MTSYNEYLQQVESAAKENPIWRIGQAFCNVLWEVNRELARRADEADVCAFYQDEKVPSFADWLSRNWEKESD